MLTQKTDLITIYYVNKIEKNINVSPQRLIINKRDSRINLTAQDKN